MMTRATIAIAVALQFLAAPVMAQGTSDKDSNAHHYQGGPQTGVQSWSRLSEQNLRVDKWSVCRG